RPARSHPRRLRVAIQRNPLCHFAAAQPYRPYRKAENRNDDTSVAALKSEFAHLVRQQGSCGHSRSLPRSAPELVEPIVFARRSDQGTARESRPTPSVRGLQNSICWRGGRPSFGVRVSRVTSLA